ncbi:MAG: hypothetical protein HYV63_09445 [Candidatus Schekmanbacteria bacterium]|nr:hypothetical protein [Candidatus Schekmanbacteria bacterium]
MSRSARTCRALLAILMIVSPVAAGAWGRQGHDMVARLAVDLLTRTEKEANTRFWRFNRYDLGYFSNVPDLVFRMRPEEAKQFEPPVHYVDLDNLLAPEQAATLPLDAQQVFSCFGGKPARISDGPLDVWNNGVLIWRAQQLYDELIRLMANAKQKEGGDPGAAAQQAAYAQLVRRTAEVAGFLSHYVADAAMPYHACTDYDGWEAQNGGVHKFFETDLLDELGPRFEDSVLALAESRREGILAHLRELRNEPAAFPRDLVLALLTDSLRNKPEVERLDKEAAVLEKSVRTDEEKTAAARRPAAEVVERFVPILRERLATGVVVLAEVWRQAWASAQRPVLRDAKYPEFRPEPEYIVLRPEMLWKEGQACSWPARKP